VLGAACVAMGIAGAVRKPAIEATAAPQSRTFAIENVRVFDGERVIERASVFVRDGLIVSVGDDATPSGVKVIDGSGKTLLPGFIDAHTHAFGDALERALLFGVTTELDMFTDHQAAAQWRKQQRTPEGAPTRADIFSAGTLVTAPKGHGTQYGMPIPTISAAADAPAFVDARLAEGSDFIKIIYEDGKGFGMTLPSIGADVMRAVISATRARGKLALVHIGSRSGADDAIAAGASGLVHLFSDQPAGPDFAARVAAAGAFVVPTLTVNESAAGIASGASLITAEPLRPYLTSAERTALKGSFPTRPGSTQLLRNSMEATRLLDAAGVPILAGTDAPNPGTTHGASIHRELELLVAAGLSPSVALAAATSTPARVFNLADRGRIAPGRRADLVLVSGNPTEDILATRVIEGVWKRGVRLERRHSGPETGAERAGTTNGIVSTFDEGGAEPRAAFGAGWQISTDTMMGGTSEAAMHLVKPGAGNSAGALEVTGKISAGAPFPWSGAMFFPATTPMTPADVSRFKEIVFWARGDGREYQVMVFATSLGNIPASQPFKPGAEWKEYAMPLSSFSTNGSDLRGVLFSASPAPGAFSFVIDEVRLR
jgi:imidazolonepropionase-like amidohydrolase